MAMARHAAGRILFPLVRQVMLSVIGTLVATVVIAALQQGSPSMQARMAASPELTSGGKFAARVEAAADSDAADAMPLLALPLLSPVRALAVAAVERQPPAGSIAAVEVETDRKPLADVTKMVRHATRAEARRRSVAEAGRDIVPPKRADYVDTVAAAVAEAAEPPAIQAGDGTGLWSSTKLILGRAATDGIALLDHFMP